MYIFLSKNDWIFFFSFLTKIEKKQTLTSAYYTKSSVYYNNAITKL